jgi:hypothetical protein
VRAFFGAVRAKFRLLAGVLAGLRHSHKLATLAINADSRVRHIALGRGTVDLVMRGDSEAQIIFINLHQNEQTSVKAARSIMGETGQLLIELRAQGNRNVLFWIGLRPYLFDPNRIFSDQGIAQTLRFHGGYSDAAQSAVVGLRTAIIDELQIDRAKMVVALHNNGAGHYTIQSYLPGAEHALQARAVQVDARADPGDFFLVTRHSAYDILCALGSSVVLQDHAAPEDGSLSHYFTEMPPLYVNVEARFGHEREQRKMLTLVLEHSQPFMAKPTH